MDDFKGIGEALQNIFLEGAQACLFLLSEKGATLDSSFYESHGHPETLHFMECLDGIVSLPVLEGLPKTPPSITKAEAQALAEWLDINSTLCVAVKTPNLRRRSKKLRSIVHPAGIPESQYFQVDGELYCASPELAFVSVATSSTDVQAIVLASLLMGIFYKDGNQLRPRRSLASAKSILNLYERTSSSHHIMPKNMTRIPKLLEYSVEKAASPKEIESALRLGLPSHLGGCGLGIPEMNHPVRIPGTNRHRYCDMYWPEYGVAVEYDSESEHTGIEALEADALHRNDLVSAGIPTYTLTNGQLNNLQLFNRVANQLRLKAGMEKLPRNRSHTETQRLLRDDIRQSLQLFGF